MSYIASFGSALPSRAVNNQALSALTGRTPEWIWNVCGIEERRWVDDDASVVDLGVAAAEDCLARSGLKAADLGMILVSCGSSPRLFPGPATEIAARLGLSDTPALDLPLASAGGLVAMTLANDLAPVRGPILVIATEIMSRVILREPIDPGVAILFGDGAGACLVHPDKGIAKVLASKICSDGTYRGDLALSHSNQLSMNGRSVILQASRKIPRAIQQVLGLQDIAAGEVSVYLMHQANQNLMDRVADALGTDRSLFFTNIRKYGNTSSASMLIAAKEWYEESASHVGKIVCFAAFGAGLQWGCLVAELLS